MIHEILRLFFNILTVKDKYYLLNRGNLTQPIQIELSQKQKTFSEFFFVFVICILNFQHLPKKDGLVVDVFLEIPALKNMVG